jgi:geranylgeranyl transferase type-2 subunit alpha
LALTTEALTINPEYYTLWNYRREIILKLWEWMGVCENGCHLQEPVQQPHEHHLQSQDHQHQQKQQQQQLERLYQRKRLAEGELKFTQELVRSHPKSYWVWKHRVWVLDNMDEPDWGRELKLCQIMLDIDPRNCKIQSFLYL